ncbi:unnamed protein product [Lasius platythorax]|uniref:Uncharacterized protein n=1 Tax=Lasius platythorax TaxID=488582 RepID=A0AAV2NW35_9HYME
MTRSRQQLYLNAGRFQESSCFKLVTNMSDLTSRYESDLASGDSVISRERCFMHGGLHRRRALPRTTCTRRSFSRRSIDKSQRLVPRRRECGLLREEVNVAECPSALGGSLHHQVGGWRGSTTSR